MEIKTKLRYLHRMRNLIWPRVSNENLNDKKKTQNGVFFSGDFWFKEPRHSEKNISDEK